jgi:hypothetical protein
MKIRVWRIVNTLIVWTLLFAVANVHAATPVYREFGSWAVGCDNTGHCDAVGNGTGANSIYLSRDSGPNGSVFVRVYVNLAKSIGGPIKVQDLRLDGKPLALDAHAWRWTDSDGALVTRDITAASSFLTALSRGHMLSRGSGKDGDFYRLDGLRPALLFIDEIQGRSGTRGALLSGGDKPDSTVPAPPELAHVSAKTSKPLPLATQNAHRLSDRVRRLEKAALIRESCDDSEMDVTSDGDLAYALNDREALVFIQCQISPVLSFLIFRTGRFAPDKITRLGLPLPLKLMDEATVDVFVNAQYDPEKQELSYQYTGMAETSGEAGTFRYDGNRFYLVDLFYLDSAHRSASGPDGWPRLWRSDASK